MNKRKKWLSIVLVLLTLVMASMRGTVLAGPDSPDVPGTTTASTIEKWVDPPNIVAKAGDVLTYTIRVDLEPASMNMELYFSDPLSMGLVWGEFIEHPPEIRWDPDLRAVVGKIDTSVTDPFTVSFTTRVDHRGTLMLKGEDIVNRAALCPIETNSIELCRDMSDPTITRTYKYLFLPLIMRNYPTTSPKYIRTKI